MRTTLTVDDDVLEAARCLAQSERISLGAAVSTLARRGMDGPEVGGAVASSASRETPPALARPRFTVAADGLPVIDVPPGFPVIDDEFVRAALADFP
jgi:hypothetical protein